ncbi:MAG: hypothetical protein ACYDGR_08735 [Candidatus Dormibacteria bacterium]
MPAWGYFVLGFFLLSLVLLTFRRNSSVSHPAAADYSVDFRLVLDEVEPVMSDLRDALRDGEERPVARAAASARTVIHRHISNIDRLAIPESLDPGSRAVLETLGVRMRQALENYEWSARIAETTDLLENEGLRRGFETLAGAGDQLFAQTRFDLVGIRPLEPTS